jgi:transcriptional regulator with XRE-family HTH domain
VHRQVIAVWLTQRVPYTMRPGHPRASDALRRFGRRVGQVRMAMGLSQRELAAIVGVDQSVISRFENGRAPGIRFDKVASILAALDIDRLDGLRPRSTPAWATEFLPREPTRDDAPWGIEPRLAADDAHSGIELGAAAFDALWDIGQGSRAEDAL